MVARVKCPWCLCEPYSGYALILHCRADHKDKIVVNAGYICPFCGVSIVEARNKLSVDVFGAHVVRCAGYSAAMLSGCALRGAK